MSPMIDKHEATTFCNKRLCKVRTIFVDRPNMHDSAYQVQVAISNG